jgi:DNA-binding response OmpR family regulator
MAMSKPRQILAVDERRATLDFLRSVLSLVEDDSFEVLGVPSGEEGLLELRRKRYDLLMSGVRLPGMDGLELARHARRLWSDMPIVLASARPSPEMRAEAAALDVSHFLSKPLDAEEFLVAVRESLSQAPPSVAPPSPDELEEEHSVMALPMAVVDRLETLCTETGAAQVLLVTIGGELLLATGSQSQPELPRLVAATAASVSCSLYLADQLDPVEPHMVQFIEGERHDLYWASVNRHHFIVILFDAQVRRGRIGTVWVFAQRAVNELKTLLADYPSEPRPAQSDDRQVVRPDPTGSSAGSAQNLAPTSDDLAPVKPPPAEPIVDSTPEADEQAHDPELDAFWDEVLAEEGGADFYTSGISLDEAKEKGLVAEDFDPEDQD